MLTKRSLHFWDNTLGLRNDPQDDRQLTEAKIAHISSNAQPIEEPLVPIDSPSHISSNTQPMEEPPVPIDSPC